MNSAFCITVCNKALYIQYYMCFFQIQPQIPPIAYCGLIIIQHIDACIFLI